MLRGTAFIQPHSDDTVMSSYFLIKAGVLPRPYYLITVFSRSNWVDPVYRARYLKPGGKPEEMITRLRMKEDKQFAKGLLMKPLFLNFRDCLLRNNITIFDPKQPLDASLVRRVYDSLHRAVTRHKILNIVIPCPSGAEQHYDHRVVYQAAKSLSVDHSIHLVDDLPYSRLPKGKGKIRSVRSVAVKSLEEKFQAMGIYDSQMCDLFFRKVKKITEMNGGFERLMTTKR
jgi:LmbE family N-acetylglucosaminyl deacetylase